MKKTAKRQEKGIKYYLFQKQNEKMTKTWQVCEKIMKKINNFQIVVHRGFDRMQVTRGEVTNSKEKGGISQ